MKKLLEHGGYFYLRTKKLLLIMRLSVLLILIAVFSSAASVYSQETKLTLKMENAKFSEVFDAIEEQSEFIFFYNRDYFDDNRIVSVDFKNEKIDKVLTELFKGQSVEYEVFDRNIVIKIPTNYQGFARRVFQQQRTVSGIVTDAEGQPLPGVSIVIKGTTRGTVTNADGEYTLSDISPDATIVFSFVGMATQEIDVETQTVINVTMEQKTIGLEEVIAVGYGVQRVEEVTGSISSVSSNELEDMPTPTLTQSLQGAMSGITVTKSHTPGEEANIYIRGLGTINNNNPLWIIDGVPGYVELSPNEIESITILKDASAQAIYGARASNGVILVETKIGKKGQGLRVSVETRYGISKMNKNYDMLNTQEYGELLWLQAKNEGIDDFTNPLYGSGDKPDIPEYINPPRATDVDHSLYDYQMTHIDGDDTFIIMKANKEGTDWMNEVTRTAGYQEYLINVTGGGDIVDYGFAASYLDEEGVFEYTGYKRYNLRSNITFRIAPWLEVGEKVGIAFDDDYGYQANNSEGSIISYVYRAQPILPVYDVMGGYAGSRAPSLGTARNCVWLLDSNQNDTYKTFRPYGNAYAKATIIEGLKFNTLFGFNYSSYHSRNLNYNEIAFSERGIYDSLSEGASFGLLWNWTNTLTYDKVLGVHRFTIMAGTEAVSSESRSLGGSRQDYFFSDPDYFVLDAGSKSQTNYGNVSEWNLFSYFGRINYTFNDKYILTASYRRDGSSRFGEGNRFGDFPAVSIGWRLSEESFMDFSKNWLDFLKLNAGWGLSGNDQIGNYNSFTTFSQSIYESYYALSGLNSGTPTAGFQSATFGNPNVRWEKTSNINVGLDATLFNNFHLSFEVWKNKTEDMLFPKRIPVVEGVASVPSINVGIMENKGFDFELGYNGNALNQDIKYNISMNVSHYKNNIVQLSLDEDEVLEGSEWRHVIYTRAENGSEFPYFYGYIIDGIFQTEEEAANHPPAFGESGRYNDVGLYKFRDVNNDNVINEKDRTNMGSPHPDFTAGLTFNFNYKNIYLATNFYGSYGNDLINYVNRWIDYNHFEGNRSKKRLYQSWGSPYLENNEDAVLQKAITQDGASHDKPTSYFVEDGSYLRMQNLRISYSLGNLVSPVLRDLQIYGNMTNVFTITNYSGLDPEINIQGINKGIDAGSWPALRQFMLGIKINL
jgi:TonB-dependent starch-binding outer membrane protein SusC